MILCRFLKKKKKVRYWGYNNKYQECSYANGFEIAKKSLQIRNSTKKKKKEKQSKKTLQDEKRKVESTSKKKNTKMHETE